MSQSMCFTVGRTERQTDISFMATPRLLRCSAVKSDFISSYSPGDTTYQISMQWTSHAMHRYFILIPLFLRYLCGVMVQHVRITRNSSGDEIANVNFLYDDIVHVLQNTIDSCINSAADRRGYVLERMCLPNSVK